MARRRAAGGGGSGGGVQESLASELAARMNAMNAASDNARDLKKNLSTIYNRKRQAKITSEVRPGPPPCPPPLPTPCSPPLPTPCSGRHVAVSAPGCARTATGPADSDSSHAVSPPCMCTLARHRLVRPVCAVAAMTMRCIRIRRTRIRRPSVSLLCLTPTAAGCTFGQVRFVHRLTQFCAPAQDH